MRAPIYSEYGYIGIVWEECAKDPTENILKNVGTSRDGVVNKYGSYRVWVMNYLVFICLQVCRVVQSKKDRT